MITILYADGTAQEGIPVSMKSQELRILTREDALVFRLVGGSWISEDNEIVTFAFLVPAGEPAGMEPGYEPLPSADAIEFGSDARSGQNWVN